jgi:Uncharacterised protein family (UPF0175)
MIITVEIPEELAGQFVPAGQDPARATVEAIALEGYRSDRLTEADIRELLGFETRMEVHGFLKEHGALRLEAERLRTEFTALAELWRHDTKHLSQIAKKIAHPAYFRIMGMGEAVVPLLLEELRERPAYWFAALRATTNVDPSPAEATPSQAREAWLEWGKSQGFIG